MSAWTCRHTDGKAAQKIVPPRLRTEEKREPVSDIDTGVVDGLKVLDPDGPIREADSCTAANGHLYLITSSDAEE
jgi:hypothetical protein